jgi:hypothetical protein
MNNHPDPARLPRLRVNLSVVRGHYADANRPHAPVRRRDALNAAVRDIPVLIVEIERLWALACDAYQRYANLRAAALASVAAFDADEHDPLFYLRDELQAHRPQPPDSRGRR